MNALVKNIETDVKHPPQPKGQAADARVLYQRTIKRFPKTMARLGE